ncbi:sulfotransferase [Halioglobus maricola]|uniref:Sulfotransferase n=1 Tax=Halioglobus maricola TaxID=2601894 RepID=A0A5P9NLX1_9GAMM|nr:sulfotransferase [Halioglobus maricola]QFU76830.1 sulfotransferase [Halioglobus maricola]
MTERLPLAIRALNSAFDLTGPVGRRIARLDPDKFIKSAQRDTGLTDFGSDYFREPLRRLCKSLEEDAHLSALGRIIARQDISRLLSNRLKFIDLFKQHPEIADTPINQPIFILGMPRTGTTSLHELVALDPQFRVPMSWEVAHPFPPPELASYNSDPRIAEVDAELAQIDRLLPNFKHMHPMGAQLPQECVGLFAYDFASMMFDVQFRLDQYQQWLLQEDMTEVFHNHRRWLQLLQWKCPADTWVLKSPQYLWNIEDMLKEYPDARIIQTHRDPVRVAMSIGSLTATLRGLGSNKVELAEVTREYADLLHYGVGKTMSARERGLLGKERVYDVQFKDFRQDPLATVEKMYAQFDYQLSPAVSERMGEFLAAGSGEKRHGQHGYTLEDSGLDLAVERQRFAAYQAAYGIELEEVS